jgi:hypothetical protein
VGFERERSMETRLFFAPVFSEWLRPRTELGAQYGVLRDPNARSLVFLPGVIGVDSVLAANDSMRLANSLTLPRRMTAAQLASAGTMIDVGKLVAAHSRDSGLVRRLGNVFAPVELTYTRTLLSALDAAAEAPPLGLQFGLGGLSSYRFVGGTPATTAGYTGTTLANNTLLLPFGTSLMNRYRHTVTRNWIRRFDATGSQAQVDGDQTVFPDVSARWSARPAHWASVLTSLGATVGFSRAEVTTSLPSLVSADPPQIGRTHVETFPVSANLAWAVRGGFNTSATYTFVRRVDSLPGSVARSNGNALNVDLTRAFRIPPSWGLGVKNDVRAHLGMEEKHDLTVVTGLGTESRLLDNGRRRYNLTANTDLNENLLFTMQGSRVVRFDRNINSQVTETVFSVVLQWRITELPR